MADRPTAEVVKVEVLVPDQHALQQIMNRLHDVQLALDAVRDDLAPLLDRC